MIKKNPTDLRYVEWKHSLLSLSLSAPIFSPNIQVNVSPSVHTFTLSHICWPHSSSFSPSLPPSLLLALDSLSLWLSVSLPTRTLHFSLALSIENSCVEQGRYQEPYKLVFLYFLNTYLYSYVYFFIPLWRPKLARGCNYVLHNSVHHNLWQQFRKALSCLRMMMHGA